LLKEVGDFDILFNMSDEMPLQVIAVTAIVKKGNKYLLAKRAEDDDQAPGAWSIPGGKVEKGKGEGRLEKILKKEVMEEVGIKIKDEVKLIYNDSFIRSSGDHVVMLTFLCEWESGEARALEDQEKVVWLTLDGILRMKGPPDYTRKRFEALNKHKPSC
jgi:ADP-ribose pyrophosphatase YjhB (NUDIX family)